MMKIVLAEPKRLIQGFVGRFVTVETRVGDMHGRLTAYGNSRHHGVGELVLENRDSWIFIKDWSVIHS